jgi:hypothetical protein
MLPYLAACIVEAVMFIAPKSIMSLAQSAESESHAANNATSRARAKLSADRRAFTFSNSARTRAR